MKFPNKAGRHDDTDDILAAELEASAIDKWLTLNAQGWHGGRQFTREEADGWHEFLRGFFSEPPKEAK